MPINSNIRNIRNAPLVSNTRNVPSAPATRSTINLGNRIQKSYASFGKSWFSKDWNFKKYASDRSNS
ncbi:unnamed protein product [Rhizophagus irregularis]|nr:unnamed protein product [Rhizophagus irregularis]CAB4425281.1 unnamed protein product [Rhizophagus irregularis]